METQSFKQALGMLLCAAAMVSMSVPALAADISGNGMTMTVDSAFVPTPRYDQTSQAQSRLKISSGKASASALVIGGSSVTKVSITATLQKKTGGKWSDVQSWSSTSKSAKCSLNKTASVSKGTYRLHVSFITYAGSKTESGSVDSNTATY